MLEMVKISLFLFFNSEFASRKSKHVCRLVYLKLESFLCLLVENRSVIVNF